jgi:hypothetical protein
MDRFIPIGDRLLMINKRVNPFHFIKDSYNKRKLGIQESDIKNNISDSLGELKRLTDYTNATPCPCCKQIKKLRIFNYRRGRLDWEAAVICESCKSKGVLNPTGLHFNLVYKDIEIEAIE